MRCWCVHCTRREGSCRKEEAGNRDEEELEGVRCEHGAVVREGGAMDAGDEDGSLQRASDSVQTTLSATGDGRQPRPWERMRELGRRMRATRTLPFSHIEQLACIRANREQPTAGFRIWQVSAGRLARPKSTDVASRVPSCARSARPGEHSARTRLRARPEARPGRGRPSQRRGCARMGLRAGVGGEDDAAAEEKRKRLKEEGECRC